MMILLQFSDFNVKSCTVTESCALLLVITTLLYLWLNGSRRFETKRYRKRRRNASCIWTRRRVHWLQKRVSRSDYVALALCNLIEARKSSESKRRDPNCRRLAIPRSKMVNCGFTLARVETANVQEEQRKSPTLDNMKSCCPPELIVESSKMNRRSFDEHVPFIVNRKRVKKHIQFRRRSAKMSPQCFDRTQEGISENSKSSGRYRRKKKAARRVKVQEVSKQTSVPEAKKILTPSYHISYESLLPVYEKMSKGRAFRPSRRVLWRNRHSLIRASRKSILRNSYDGCIFSASRDIEYDVPEPPEEDEDPEWQTTGPEYASDVISDGPFSASPDIDYDIPEPLEEVEDPECQLIGPEYPSDITSDGPLTQHATEDPPKYVNNSLLLGMGPEFLSDIAGDCPEYGDMNGSDNSSSVEDSDSGSTGGSASSYDPIKEKKLLKKKRDTMLRRKRRRDLGEEARRKEYEA